MSEELRKKAEEVLSRNPVEVPVLSTSQVQKLIHELDVHQIELQMQNEELRQAQVELALSRDAYVELFDFAPVGYLIVDFESRIIDANFTAATMLGTERGKLVGATFAGFVHRDAIEAWDAHRRHVLEGMEKHGADLLLQRGDGAPFTAHVECAPRPDAGHCLMTLTDLAERMQVEALAAEAAERWQTTFDAMADAVFILDENQHVLLANQAASSVFACSAEEMKSRPCWEIVHGTEGPLKECPVQRMFKSGRRESMDLIADDSCFQVTADPLKDRDGKLCGAIHIVRDVTASKQTELALQQSERDLAILNLQLERRVRERSAALHESEERFRRMFEEAPDASFLIDLEGLFVDGNKAVEEQIGYSRDELIGQSVFESNIFPPIARTTAAERIERLSRGEKLEPIEYVLHRKDGSELPVEVSSMLVQIHGSPVLLSSSRDLTARKQAEKTLRESEERSRTIFDQIPDGILMADPETRKFRMASQAFCTKMGYSEEQVLEMGSEGIHPAEDLPYVIDAFEKQARGEVEEVYNIPFLRSDGGIFYADMRAFRILLDGKPYLMGHVRDISMRKRTQDALRESEEKYRKVFESESDAIMIFDAETRQFVDVNDAAVELYGYSREEFLQLKQSDITDEPDASEDAIRKALKGQLSSIPLRMHRKKGGTVFPVEIAACTFVLKGRQVLCGVVRDITKRVAREKEINHNREELRKLTSELSLAEQRERERVARELHDGVCQLLSSANLRLCILRESALPADALESLNKVGDIVEDSLRQIRSLTFELSCPMLNELGLAAALDELCSSMSHEAGICFEFEGNMELLPLHMDRKIVLYRSARELLINVMKHSDAQWASVKLDRVDDTARISVEDDGKGFNADLAGRGFSPTGGFGLFNIREYLRHAGGSLDIESIPGDGTEVVLTVPLEEGHG